MKCYKRLIYKQFVQVSGLCDSVSELFTETFHVPLQSFVWRRHTGAPFWCTNMAAGNQQKHLEFTFSIKALSFHSRTSIRAHKHFFQRDSISILVSLTVKTRKFKLLYFRNETCYGNGNLYKDLFFVYLQPSVNKNS